MGVKILIQDFCGLFTEVAPFPPEKRQENHSCSRRAELQLGRGVGAAPVAHPQHAAPSAAARPCGLHAKELQHPSVGLGPGRVRALPPNSPSLQRGLHPDGALMPPACSRLEPAAGVRVEMS